jgi:hypothetical protein
MEDIKPIYTVRLMSNGENYLDNRIMTEETAKTFFGQYKGQFSRRELQVLELTPNNESPTYYAAVVRNHILCIANKNSEGSLAKMAGPGFRKVGLEAKVILSDKSC